MEMLRRQFGIAEPVRRGMELKITEAGEWRPAALGRSSGVHKDILEGRDTEIGWEDVFTGRSQQDNRRAGDKRSLGIANMTLQATSFARYQTSTPRSRRR
jgi:hypothetical protein